MTLLKDIAFALSMLLLSSCIRDDITLCTNVFEVKLTYDYNMHGENILAREANRANVYVFDRDSILISVTTQEGDLSSIHPVSVSSPYSDKYHFVAVARSSDIKNEYADVMIPEMIVGQSKLQEFKTALKLFEGNVQKCKLNNFLIGYASSEERIEGGRSSEIDIRMKKLNKDLRIVLLPVQGGKSLAISSFDFGVEDKFGDGSVDYKFEPLSGSFITYKPYSIKTVADNSGYSILDSDAGRAVTADLSTARLISSYKPEIVIKNNETDFEIIRLDLTWLISLADRNQWDLQEYLDREDKYTFTFFIDGDSDTLIKTKIIVNDWYISIEDIEI